MPWQRQEKRSFLSRRNARPPDKRKPRQRCVLAAILALAFISAFVSLRVGSRAYEQLSINSAPKRVQPTAKPLCEHDCKLASRVKEMLTYVPNAYVIEVLGSSNHERLSSMSNAALSMQRDVYAVASSHDASIFSPSASSSLHKFIGASSLDEINLPKGRPFVLNMHVDEKLKGLLDASDQICNFQSTGNVVLLAAFTFDLGKQNPFVGRDGHESKTLADIFKCFTYQGLLPFAITSTGKEVRLDESDLASWIEAREDGSSTLRIIFYPSWISSPRNAGFTVQESYINYIQTLGPLPKHLHLIFPDKNFYTTHSDIPFVQHSILRFIGMNPSWKVTVHDDADMDAVIRHAAKEGIIAQEECNILVGDGTSGAAHPVERSDLARMLIMYFHGGMYVDMDTMVNARNFDEIFHSTIRMCLPIFMESNFAQSTLCASPKNKLYLKIINAMSKHRMTSNKGQPLERRGGWSRKEELFSMGPPIYNRLVFKLVFGLSVNGNLPGKELGVPIEDAMNAIKDQAGHVIATGKFVSQCDSFIAAPFEGCEARDRRELYSRYQMGGWGEEVKLRWAGQ